MTVLAPDEAVLNATDTRRDDEVYEGLDISSLSKSYSGRPAVTDVSFALGKGVTALLGPNGAGKSTIMRCVVGLQSWDSGSIAVGGVDVLANPRAARAMLGYMPERVAFPGEMRVRAYLDYVARMKGVARANRADTVDTAMSRLDLNSVATRVIGNLSKGYRQRVGLAQATLGDPPVLVLDEPLAGVDPLHVWEFRDVLWEYSRDRTVVLSTHILPEARVLCDRVIVIAKGRIAFDGSLVEAELSSSVTRRWRVGIAGGDEKAVLAAVRESGASVVHSTTAPGGMNLVIDAGRAGVVDALVRRVLAENWKLAHVEPMTDLIQVAFEEAGLTSESKPKKRG